jgi:hypothetical protein
LAAGADLAKIVGILLVGMAATLLFTAQTAVWIRTAVKTENKEVVKAKPSPPFDGSHYAAWGAVAAASLVGCAVNPAAWGAQLALPFTLACTVGGRRRRRCCCCCLARVAHRRDSACTWRGQQLPAACPRHGARPELGRAGPG